MADTPFTRTRAGRYDTAGLSSKEFSRVFDQIDKDRRKSRRSARRTLNPLTLKNKALDDIIALGKKKSGTFYTKEDLKGFEANRTGARQQFNSSQAGITYAQLVASSQQIDIKRANNRVPVMRWIGNRIANQIMVVTGEIETQPATLPAPPAAKKKRAPARKISDDKYPRSFLKWAGGKHSVLDEIRAMLPTGDRLIEPFVGSGTVFINAGFKCNLLGDVNPDLINLFNQLQGNPDAVIKTAYQLERGCISGKAHDAIRTEFNGRKAHAVRHAALFLALMRTSYNGLCRYNQKGLFNVGWNKKGEANYFPMDELAHFTGMQKEMTFMCAGFEDVIAQACEGDVVFCDPPYEPLPDEAGFTAYSGTSFTFADQVRLVESLVAARDRGAKVVITNSSAPAILHLYISNGFRIAPLATRRSVSCKSETRKTVNDIIAAL